MAHQILPAEPVRIGHESDSLIDYLKALKLDKADPTPPREMFGPLACAGCSIIISSTSFECRRCRCATYCSLSCKESHQQQHKQQCRRFRKFESGMPCMTDEHLLFLKLDSADYFGPGFAGDDAAYRRWRCEKSYQFYERNLRSQEKTFGPTHPLTLRTIFSMAMLLHFDLEKFEKAEELYRMVLAGRENTMGATHSLTKNCARSLAILLEEQVCTAKLRKLLNDFPDVDREEEAAWAITSQTPPLLSRVVAGKREEKNPAE